SVGTAGSGLYRQRARRRTRRYPLGPLGSLGALVSGLRGEVDDDEVGRSTNTGVREHSSGRSLAAETTVAALRGQQGEPRHVCPGLGDGEWKIGCPSERLGQCRFPSARAVGAAERRERVAPRIGVLPGERRATALELERLRSDSRPV